MEAEAPVATALVPFAASAGLDVGGFTGHGIWRQAGGVLVPTLRLSPEFELGKGTLAVPVLLRHRQALGSPLSESRGQLEVNGKWRFASKLRVGAEAGVVGVWRPGWPDLYQPLATGGNTPTSRYSHLDARAGVQVAGIPFKHQHARAKYRYTAARYLWDPAYQPLTSLTHLAPFDNDEHTLALSWRYLGHGWKLGATAELFERNYLYRLARDAASGRTHAGTGGAPPNPPRVFLGVEPGLEGEWKSRAHRLEISAAFGFEIVEDLYQGYYSFTGLHPQLQLEYQPVEWLALVLRGEAWLRSYGANGYQAGPNSHPPLLWGARREDDRITAALGGRVPLRPGLDLTAELSWVLRRTNFPTYVPQVYPANNLYDIDWNYVNLNLGVGLVWRFGAAPADAEASGRD